jgi:hypothetical protein
MAVTMATAVHAAIPGCTMIMCNLRRGARNRMPTTARIQGRQKNVIGRATHIALLGIRTASSKMDLARTIPTAVAATRTIPSRIEKGRHGRDWMT